MSDAADVALATPKSLTEVFPGRWWVPSADALAEITTGWHVKARGILLEADGSADPWGTLPFWLAVGNVDGECVEGRVTSSQLYRSGFRDGDTVRVALDEIFDFHATSEDGRPLINEARARFMLGKMTLVGLTTRSKDGAVNQDQFVCTLIDIEPTRGLHMRLVDGSAYVLPPDVRNFEEARPGSYRLRASQTVVTDPDYISTWTRDMP